MASTSISASALKKRKRTEHRDEDISFHVAEPSSGLGPVLVSFPSLSAPESTPFQCYRPKKDTGFNHLIVVGETDSVEFVSDETTAEVAQAGCKYLLAVHNPRTSSVEVLPMATSPHVLARNVKKLKTTHENGPGSVLAYREARNTLGETFGTKKAKAAIRAEERKHIDVSAMEGVMDSVMATITKGAQGLPTKDEAKDTSDANRLIPPFNATTLDTAEIYPLHDIIPEAEWKEITVAAFDEASSDQERMDLLPFKRSDWLRMRMKSTMQQETGNGKKRKLKIIYYVSCMFAFHNLLQRKNNKIDKDVAHSSLAGVPSVIVESLMTRFTEHSRDSTANHSTSATETKLFTHMFALCLRVDSFVTNPGVLGTDLHLSLPKVKLLFASLGCKLEKVDSERQRAKLGLSDEFADVTMAILRAPVEFPKIRRRKARR